MKQKDTKNSYCCRSKSSTGSGGSSYICSSRLAITPDASEGVDDDGEDDEEEWLSSFGWRIICEDGETLLSELVCGDDPSIKCRFSMPMNTKVSVKWGPMRIKWVENPL